MRTKDLDIVYISYDEPNSEENYHDLKSKFPNAKRVHKVEGFDQAHQKAAQLSSTSHLFVVDGDNKVTTDFLNLEINEEELIEGRVLSWGSKNIINSLIYGNGGIKLWPKKTLLKINSHSSNNNQTDFCHDTEYMQMNDWYSYSVCNASPYQAFRSGFREGVKLCLNPKGERYGDLLKDINLIPEGNLRRLIAWMTVGEDVTNGVYSIFGARLAFLKTVCEPHFNISIIKDYQELDHYWNSELNYVRKGNYREHYDLMASDIRKITSLPISNLDSLQSKTFKKLMFNPKREGLMELKPSEASLTVRKNYVEKSI